MATLEVTKLTAADPFVWKTIVGSTPYWYKITVYNEDNSFVLQYSEDEENYVDIFRFKGDPAGLPVFSNNTDAVDGGLTSGCIYRTGDLLKIVH